MSSLHHETLPVSYCPDAGVLLEYLASRSLLATSPTTSAHLPGQRPVDTVLLESVDIATKVSRTTIAVLDANVRLTCRGHEVLAEALPQAGGDGLAALEELRQGLHEEAVEEEGSAQAHARFRFSEPDPHAEERERLIARSNVEPLRVLAARDVAHPHLPLLAGAFAFDYLETFEQLPTVPKGANTCPDYLFYDARIILVIDHPTQQATLVGAATEPEGLRERLRELASAIDAFDPAVYAAGRATSSAVDHAESAPAPHAGSRDAGSPATLTAYPTQSDADFETTVRTMQEAIAAGDIYQVVPSRGFTVPCPDALAAYHELRRSNPSPYMFYVAAPDFELLGASPESALQYSARSGEVAIRPIAGTRPRGFSPTGEIDHELDTRLELELRTDAKEVAEHVMLVDLARNDVARVCLPSTRQVKDLLRVDRYSRVMHLVSEVTGTLDPELDALDAFRASMTMGTLTGAPKLRAAELIREREGQRRGSYGGSVGYLRGDGEFDTCIVIRSAFVADGQALVQAGAGVVADSVPAMEAAETVHKASAVLRAIAAAQGAQLAIAAECAPGPMDASPKVTAPALATAATAASTPATAGLAATAGKEA